MGEASKQGYRRAVEALLAANADIELKCPAENGGTPLAIAVSHKQHEVTDLLIKVRHTVIEKINIFLQ